MSTMDTVFDGVVAARTLRDISQHQAAESENDRTLSPRMVEALWDTGLMTYMNVPDAGGCEPSFIDVIETWIELAWQDGSLGWIGIANLPTTMAASAYLPDDGFAEMFGSDERVTAGGQFFPNGVGTKVDGGYRLSGTFNFGSGTAHSDYVACGFMPMIDGEMVFELLAGFVAYDDVQFLDGWHVQGLRGTGSYDYSVSDVFVPEHRCFPLFQREPHRGESPLFKMGLMPITAAGHASWALGVAKSMLDDVAELSITKSRMSDMEPLVRRATFQRNFAHHTGMWRAARAGVIDAFTAAEDTILLGGELTPQLRANMRIAATYATEASREVAQFAHLAAGTTAIRNGSRLERAFRDIYTGTQHAFISEKTYIDSAQVLLGLEDDNPGL
jgi:indole-3-acetate monooxygenase